MTEAVIVSTARTPIGRMGKGSLKDMRPDDLSALIIRSVLGKIPALDPTEIEDVLWGCGQPGGESGHNIGRVSAVLAGLDDVPGVTVNRYCSSSLMTIRMAAHAIKAGDGDVFLAGGVETASRFPFGMADGPKNPVFGDAGARSAKRAEGGAPTWTPAEGLPDVYLAMGQTAENVAQIENVSRADQDEFAARSQNRAEESLNNGYWEAEITPVTTPDGEVTKDDGIRRRHDGREALGPRSRVPARRHRDRRQRLSPQRRRRRRRRDERHQGEGPRPDPARPHRLLLGHRPEPRDHGHGPGRGDPQGPRPCEPDHRRHRPVRDQRGVRRPGPARRSVSSASRWRSSTPVAARSPWATPSA